MSVQVTHNKYRFGKRYKVFFALPLIGQYVQQTIIGAHTSQGKYFIRHKTAQHVVICLSTRTDAQNLRRVWGGSNGGKEQHRPGYRANNRLQRPTVDTMSPSLRFQRPKATAPWKTWQQTVRFSFVDRRGCCRASS